MIMRTKMFNPLKTIISMMIIAVSMTAYAAPKDPTPQTIIQPDGTNIVIIERGDEFISWATDLDGYLVAYDEKTGFWKYAYVNESSVPTDRHVNVNITVPSDGQKHLAETYIPLFVSIGEKNRIAHNSDRMADYAAYEKMRSRNVLEPFSTEPAEPAYRSRRVLLVVIDYRDQKSYVDGRDDKFWYDMYFNTTPGHKSVKNFFKDMADGRDVYIEASTEGIPATPTNIGVVRWNNANAPQWVRNGAGVIINSPYPGFIRMQIDAPRPAGDAVNEQSIPMILAAIESNYPELFAAYQTLGASNLRIALVTPGGGGYAFWVRHTPLGGIDAAGNGHTFSLGAHIHESGHAYFSLPDLYSYDFSRPKAEGIGFYCVMSFGMYGNLPDEPRGSNPVAMSAPLRDRLGWGNTITVEPEYSWDGNLIPIGHTDHHLLRVNSAVDATQYFIVDNIAFENWNRSLSGNQALSNGGIMIYHINTAAHTTPFGFGANSYWTRGQRFTVHVELADGSMYNADGTVRDWGWTSENAFYHSGFNSTFNATSTPNSHFYRATSPHTKNVPSNIDIRVPGARGDSMRVQVIGEKPQPPIPSQVITFPAATETKTFGVAPFTIAADHSVGTGAITYSSSNTSVATVNPATGEITITGVGQTIITASAAAVLNVWLSASASYTLIVNEAASSITNVDRNDSRYGIKFTINPVSEQAEISVVLPDGGRIISAPTVVIYDMTGNVVFSRRGDYQSPADNAIIWDLRNTAGRFVANGTYLVVAEAKDKNGGIYRYSARLGVKR